MTPVMTAEPWLRGPISGVHPLIAPFLYVFQHAREDLDYYTDGLTAHQIWARPHGFGSVGFHLRHMSRSTDRLITYLRGDSLSEEQVAQLRQEMDPGASREQLLAELERSFRRAEEVVRSLDPAILTEARYVGRNRLPTTVIGLLSHTAEHIQRHVGQAISASKLARTL